MAYVASREGTLRHMVLEMPRSLLKVTRWSMESGEPSHWHIVGCATRFPRPI
jgi:hypothetical protein